MARRPHTHQSTGAQQWINFFVGSPRRALFTFVVLLAAFAALFPNEAAQMMNNVLVAFVSAVYPLVGPLLGIAIAVWAIYAVILRPLRPKKKKKKDEH